MEVLLARACCPTAITPELEDKAARVAARDFARDIETIASCSAKPAVLCHIMCFEAVRCARAGDWPSTALRSFCRILGRDRQSGAGGAVVWAFNFEPLAAHL
eukprot:12300585-Alexandrium_andersonii.AAC.1